jgi:sensor histidine kinase regulating citrate/malate metabolism
VAQGLTRTDMCQEFNIKNKNNYIVTLRESNTRQTTELDKLKLDLLELRANSELINDKLETSRAILNQIPSGVVIVDEKLKILSSNHSFIDLLGDEAREIDDIIPGLRGANLKTLVPVQFYKVFQNVLDTGEDILSRDVKIEDAFLNLSVFSIKHGKVAGGIVRDMFSPEVRNEQIIQRVTEVIDQNLEMVQQIGFLLGEGASKTEAMLNSIIQLHRKKKGEGRS